MHQAIPRIVQSFVDRIELISRRLISVEFRRILQTIIPALPFPWTHPSPRMGSDTLVRDALAFEWLERALCSILTPTLSHTTAHIEYEPAPKWAALKEPGLGLELGVRM